MLVLHFFLVAGHAILAATLQVAHVSPSPVGDASHRFRHDSYVDKKVRQVAVNILNHQDYHQRNVIFPSSASIFPSFVSNLTSATSLLLDAGLQLQATSTIPSFTSLHLLRSTGVGGLSLVSVAPSMVLHPALNNSVSNLSVVVSFMSRTPSSSQTLSSSTLPSFSLIRPIGNATKSGPIETTFAASASCHSAATNRPGVRPTGFTFTASASFPSHTNATGVLLKGSASTASAYSSCGTLNMAHIGSTGRTYTASRYNSSVATGVGPLVPAPVASSHLSRYAVADSLQLTANLSLAAVTGVSWEKDTDNACSSQLGTLNGIATNPSGISPCYNVRTLNVSTGAFNAELRLYRITTATGDWTQLRSEGVTVGMAYPDASVNLQWIVRKRDLVEFQGLTVHTVVPQLSTRASDAAPKLLQTLSFLGQVYEDSVPELYIKANALALLSPKINLAGTAHSGAPISTQLSLQDSSFVNGMFANHTPNAIGASTMVVGSREWLSKANSFSGFPLGLFLVAVWSAVLFTMEGYEMLEKLKCRTEDRRRMLAASSGGVVEM